MTDNQIISNTKLEIIKASEITPKEVRWLWYPYIPFGKVTLLQGDPGDGKCKLMLSLAALLSKGAAACFTTNENNLRVGAAYILPVSNFTGENFCDLLDGEVGNLVFGTYDYCNSVECQGCFFKAGGLFISL